MAIFQLTIHDFCASPEDKKVDLSLTTGAKLNSCSSIGGSQSNPSTLTKYGK